MFIFQRVNSSHNIQIVCDKDSAEFFTRFYKTLNPHGLIICSCNMLSKIQVQNNLVTLRCSSALSFIGSVAMIIDIITSGGIGKQCRLRILMGVSVLFDIMSSSAIFMGSWPTEKTPVGKYFGLNSYGNYYTCQAQGFFGMSAVGSICYNVCLALYCVIFH